jgi:hypothetical protein
MFKSFLTSLLTLTLSSLLIAQEVELVQKIAWQHFVNVDFELSMPVAKTNLRPISVPETNSLVKNMLPTVAAFDLMEYRGSNEEFFCTVQLTAFSDDMNVEGVATKLMQQLKENYDELKDKEKLYENIDRVGGQRKLYLAYRGIKEHFSIIVYISERRVIAIQLSDVSDNQQWTKQFLASFKVN